MGLGVVLVAFGLWMVFTPVITEDSEPSCGDRPALAVALGSPTTSSLDGDWCRDEAGGQVMGGIVFLVLPGSLTLTWQARRAWRARRDLRPDATGIGHTPDGLEPAHPFRRLPGRLVSAQNRTWLIIEDRPDRSTLLVTGRTGRYARHLPRQARELDVAGDTSRRVAFRAPGSAKEFIARPDLADRLRQWWAARSRRRQDRGLAGDLFGPPSQPSVAVASLPRPDALQPGWAHPPARWRLQRSLRFTGLALGAALLGVTVIVWAAVSDQRWFWETDEHRDANDASTAEVFLVYTAIFAVVGVIGIVRFLRRRDILRRRPWELADIMTPDLRQVVLRQHAGSFGPVTYRVATFDEKAGVRVLACKQLWFATGSGGELLAATPDFRTMVWLRPTGPQDGPSPARPHGNGA